MTSSLRKQRPDFTERRSDEQFYDLEFDKDLIESSLASQYGVRLRLEEDISYAEYERLLAGLLPETPLGKIVQIRMEKDPKAIKAYGSFEKKVRADWAKFKRSQVRHQQMASVNELQEMFKTLFSKKRKGTS